MIDTGGLGVSRESTDRLWLSIGGGNGVNKRYVLPSVVLPMIRYYALYVIKLLFMVGMVCYAIVCMVMILWYDC